jgi:hypothetical protein
MYKLLLFLKKTDDEEALDYFNKTIINSLSEAAGKEVKAAVVESSLLLQEKYIKFCEIETASKEQMDEMMSNAEGRNLSKQLENFHEYINLIFVDYNRKE